MNKKELVRIAANEANFTQNAMQIALEAICSTIVDHVSVGERVCIQDFGTFVREHRNQRVGQNPNTGEKVIIPARNRVGFHPGKEFQRATDEMSEPRR